MGGSPAPARLVWPGHYFAVRTIVLVEGVTDEIALTLAAQRLERNLMAEGVPILPINGAHAIGRVRRQLGFVS